MKVSQLILEWGNTPIMKDVFPVMSPSQPYDWPRDHIVVNLRTLENKRLAREFVIDVFPHSIEER